MGGQTARMGRWNRPPHAMTDAFTTAGFSEPRPVFAAREVVPNDVHLLATAPSLLFLLLQADRPPRRHDIAGATRHRPVWLVALLTEQVAQPEEDDFASSAGDRRHRDISSQFPATGHALRGHVRDWHQTRRHTDSRDDRSHRVRHTTRHVLLTDRAGVSPPDLLGPPDQPLSGAR